MAQQTASILFSGAGTTSDSYLNTELLLCGFAFPSGWSSGNITFQTSLDGGTTWFDVYKSDGTAVTLTGAADGRLIAINPAELAWCKLLRLVSSVSQTDKTVTCVLVRTY